MNLVQGRTIWDVTRISDRENIRIEFPDLARFRGHWYCSFREGEIHDDHPSGRGRVIRSSDGGQWQSVALFEWDGGDVREPRLSITAESQLMVSAQVIFVSKEPRTGGDYHQLDGSGLLGGILQTDLEHDVSCQCVTWLSSDGEDWGSAYACPSGVNTRRYSVTWHNGMGYSFAQIGRDIKGTIYRTRDGKSWRVLADNLMPDLQSDEAAIAFGTDNTAYCLMRGSSVSQALLGIGRPPYYQDWEWKSLLADYGPECGGLQPIQNVLRVGLGGPNLIRLNDGRLLGAGRALGPGRDDGHATLFLIDPEKVTMTMIAEFDGTSYPGIVEHEGMIWVTYVSSLCHKNIWEVHLAKVKVSQ